MRQFDVFLNPSERGRDVAPFFVVLSSHHLQSISEVVVAPLIRDWTKSLNDVDVIVGWRGETLLLAMTELFSMPSATAIPRRGSSGSRRPHPSRARPAVHRLLMRAIDAVVPEQARGRAERRCSGD